MVVVLADGRSFNVRPMAVLVVMLCFRLYIKGQQLPPWLESQRPIQDWSRPWNPRLLTFTGLLTLVILVKNKYQCIGLLNAAGICVHDGPPVIICGKKDGVVWHRNMLEAVTSVMKQ